jgi:hypothetical protein
MIRYIILICIGSIALSSCNRCSSEKTDSWNDIPQEVIDGNNFEDIVVPVDVINQMVNVSSPVETAALIKGLKIPFNRDYLADTKFTNSYSTSFKKALGLGVFGADMGYLNMYEKPTLVIDYLSSVNSLADGLQVGQFFDFKTLKRIATNKENLDSLMVISQQSFNKIDNYLKQTNRGSLSVVIIAGVWLEGFYLSTRVYQDSKHIRIRETIGEQKIVMSNLMVLLEIFKKDSNIAALIKDFNEIKVLFNDVVITVVMGEEPIPIVKNGVVTFIQSDKQTVEMSDETLGAIIEKVQSIRKKIVEG